MGKRKRGANPPPQAQSARPAPQDSNGAESGEIDLGFDLDVAVKAAARLVASQGNADAIDEALLEVARPIISERAAKYHESAQAAKQVARELGKPVKAKPQNGAALRNVTQPGGSPAAPALSSKELSAAIAGFRVLASKPQLIEARACKALRSTLHPLVASHLQESKASPAFRITCMLSQRPRWPEAHKLLTELRDLEPQKRPKLGAYQRWIRELDVAEGSSPELLMLDSVMRLASAFPRPATSSSVPSSAAAQQQLPEGKLAKHEPFQAPGHGASLAKPDDSKKPAGGDGSGGEAPQESAADRLVSMIAAGRKLEAASGGQQKGVKVIAHEVAQDRKPPNHFDLNIYSCEDATLGIKLADQASVVGNPVPGVTGAFVLSGVLDTEECSKIIETSEAIGYTPDTPLSSNLDERAHNVVLMATEAQNEALFRRVKALLPPELAGDSLLTINRRWRLYRYQAGNLYRKHLDGAWPASGMRSGPKGQQEYVYDAYGGAARSRLTFIIYLNDDFEGGETTFFVPRLDVEGMLDSRPVRPCRGCATVFPHGDTGVPLLHEGSAVIKGTKYLLRTDVVYMADQDPKALKEAARLRGLARRIGLVPEGEDMSVPAPSEKKAKARKEKQPARTRKGKKVINTNLKGQSGHQKSTGKAKDSKSKQQSEGKSKALRKGKTQKSSKGGRGD